MITVTLTPDSNGTFSALFSGGASCHEIFVSSPERIVAHAEGYAHNNDQVAAELLAEIAHQVETFTFSKEEAKLAELIADGADGEPTANWTWSTTTNRKWLKIAEERGLVERDEEVIETHGRPLSFRAIWHVTEAGWELASAWEATR